MRSLRPILLVDDSARDRELVVDALTEAHVANEIVQLEDGEEALAWLSRAGAFAHRPQADPCVVLLDLKMPKVDGLEVLKAAKADPHLRLLPIVVMTSSREESDLLSSYRLGANAYVVKPLDFHDFADAIRGVGAFWAIVNEPPPAGGS